MARRPAPYASSSKTRCSGRIVRRAFKGHGVSRALLEWAKGHARAQGRSRLRLDCDADRPKLRALYESCGFRLHSYRQVGPYYVSRYEIETA